MTAHSDDEWGQAPNALAAQRLGSERELARQLARVSAVNSFALGLRPTLEPAQILALGAELIASLFPLDQCIGFFTHEPGRMRLAGVHGTSPRAEDLAAAAAVRLPAVETSGDPLLGRAPEIVRGHPEWDGVLAVVSLVVGAAEADGEIALLLPIVGASGLSSGVLVFRQSSALRAASQAQEGTLPTASDGPFLQLIAQQVGAAMTNAALMAELKQQGEMLARAQQESIARERLAALGELAAVVAHEVRNPVAVIFNSVASLERLIDGPGTATSLLGIVREEAERLSHMVNDLLDFARPSSPQLRDEDVRSIVDDAVLGVRNTSIGSELVVEVRSEAAPVVARCDVRMIRQVMVNLLLNAHEASLGVGPVLVELGTRETEGRGVVEIAVVDRGAGIEPGGIERLFQPFFTTKARGTGLGLAIVKRFVELNEGTVTVASEERSGTTFRVRLPAARGDLA